VLDPFVTPDWSSVMAPASTGEGHVQGDVPQTFPLDFSETVKGHERALLEAALKEAQFSQRQAADLLGLTYYQFRHHLRLHGLADKEARKALTKKG